MTSDFNSRRSSNFKPKLSPEEYAKAKQEEKEAVYNLIDTAISDIVNNPAEFQKYLDTQARMDRYSAANALLIYKQCPEATQLKDFNGWRDDNIRVKKGAKSISILEPVDYTKADGSTGISYNVKKAFDISQTNGRRQPAPTVNRDPKNLVSVMLDTSPVNCESSSELPNPDAVAYYDNDKNTLFIKKGVGDSVALFQGVALELGYAELSGRSDSYSRKDMSFQAVCVGYMLCKKYGVEAKNFAVDRIPPEWKNKEPKEVRADVITTFLKGERYDINGETKDWVEIEAVTELSGYVKRETVYTGYFLDEAIYFSLDGVSETRQDLIRKAFEYYGGTYVWGGKQLTAEGGVDCSGYTMCLYKLFGVQLPEFSGAQAEVGMTVDEDTIRPGDLIFYVGRYPGVIGHVAIYIGNGKIIHAASESKGICVSSWKYGPPVIMKNVMGD